MRLRFCWIIFLGTLAAALPQEKPAPQSAITIKAFKSGLFSGFAHNHIVVAPIARANVDPGHMTAEITVVTKDMKVTDPEASAKDRAEIQSTMLGPKVLDQEKYPEIRFKSSRIEQTAPQHYRVTGMLELHGATRQLSFDVSATPPSGGMDRYQGTTRLKQSEFGIKPISLFGGSVKVKDELELEFDVYVPAAVKSNKSTGTVLK